MGVAASDQGVAIWGLFSGVEFFLLLDAVRETHGIINLLIILDRAAPGGWSEPAAV